MLFVLAFGLWLVYTSFRSLQTGSIKYSVLFTSTYARNESPFWYWFYTAVAGFIGIGLIIASVFFTFVKL
jgi:hypothetical protein